MGFYLQTAFANFKFDNTIQLNYKWGLSVIIGTKSLDNFCTKYIDIVFRRLIHILAHFCKYFELYNS